MEVSSFSVLLAQQQVMPPGGAMPTVEVGLRLVHFVAGITWIGLLYFFNLVNVPFMKEVDAGMKPTVFRALTLRALWWFRWGAVVTVLVGFFYWLIYVMRAARNAPALDLEGSVGWPVLTFFLIWIAVWAVGYVLLVVSKLDNGLVIGVIFAAVVFAASWLFLVLNSDGWEGHQVRAIGIGGGMGLVMLLNVWGIIWRHQKKIINGALAGTPPANGAVLARQAFLTSRLNFWLSFPMLFFMAASSHYQLFVQ
jgi:uncharacterized membrane protein